MQNFMIECLDPKTGKSGKYWVSRSVAVVGFIFCKDQKGKWYVLANQRGNNAPDFKHHWNCVCGYLDYDENANEAIKREVWEETGLDILRHTFIPYFVNSSKYENRQNVTIRFYNILNGDITKWSNFSFENNEPGEVANIRWIAIDDIDEYTWAFDHDAIIKDVYDTFINISWWKRYIINKYHKMVTFKFMKKLMLNDEEK